MSDIPNAKAATMIAVAAQVRWMFSTADSRSDTNSGYGDILMISIPHVGDGRGRIRYRSLPRDESALVGGLDRRYQEQCDREEQKALHL
jgi:hypothetical protein